jgi:hypothetical protein
MASAAKSKSASGTQKLNRPRRNTVQPFAAAAHRGKRRSPAVTPIAPGISDYNRSQEVVEFDCGITHLLKGGFTENPSTKIDTHSSLQPLGPAGIISPFNFPAMVSMWFFPIAIAAATRLCSNPARRILRRRYGRLGFEPRRDCRRAVFNVLQGDKTAVDELLTTRRSKRFRSWARPQSLNMFTPPELLPTNASKLWEGQESCGDSRVAPSESPSSASPDGVHSHDLLVFGDSSWTPQ